MRKFLTVALACACTGAVAAEMTEQQKTLYAIGQVLARQVGVFQLTAADLDAVQKGLADGVLGRKSAVDMNVYAPKLQAFAESRQKTAADKAATEGRSHLAKAEKAKGAVKAPSGFVIVMLRDGSGAKPGKTDTVKVHYRGTLLDGTEFDSSYARKEPAEFPLDHVIRCWTEGVQMMKAGGKARLTCPPETAYGARGAGGVIPPNATLTFEIELLSFKATPKPLPGKDDGGKGSGKK